MSIIPQSVTEFPWRVLGLLAAIALFGTLVLYLSLIHISEPTRPY